jgi:hypothetical protein
LKEAILRESQKNWRRLFWQVRNQCHLVYTNSGTNSWRCRWRYRLSYAFHGWAKIGRLDPLEQADLANLVKSTCPRNRIVPDGVINHTGPVTETDVAWPITGCAPVCDYKNYQNTTECT